MKEQLQTAFSNRQYMLSRDFELYYYEGYRLSPVASHTHDYYEFYFFMEGEMEMDIKGAKHSVCHGDILLIPPGTEHHPCFLNRDKPYRRFVLWLSKEYCNHLLSLSTDYVYLMQHVMTTKNYVFHNDRITFNAVQLMIFRLIDEMKQERFGKDTEIILQLNSLILHLNRLVYNKNSQRPKKQELKLYQSICHYIEEHLQDDLSLDQLARKFYVSKFHVSHSFKSNIGISIHQYIMKKRLEACKNAILSQDSITSVFRQYGFHDYSSFYRAFKKEYGISPREFKERYYIEYDGHQED